MLVNAPQKIGKPWRGLQIVTGRFDMELGHKHGMLRCIDGLVRIHKNVPAPNAIKDVLPGHQLTTSFNQQKQHGNALEPDHAARSAQLEGSPAELNANRKISTGIWGGAQTTPFCPGGCRRHWCGRFG